MALTNEYMERVASFESWARKNDLSVDMRVLDGAGAWYRNVMTEHAFSGFMHGVSVGLSYEALREVPAERREKLALLWVGMDGMKKRSLLYKVLGVAWYDAIFTPWDDLPVRVQDALIEAMGQGATWR